MHRVVLAVSVFALSLGATSAFAFDLKSNDLTNGSTIGKRFVYQGMGCTGDDASPELHWSNAPKGTRSFAVTVYDPDAPTGSGWWHWIAYNIPADATSLPQGWKAANGAAEVTNDFGNARYDGPCPPPGKPHHYHFTVHALKTDDLDVPQGATNAFARFMINASTIGKASFTALYGR